MADYSSFGLQDKVAIVTGASQGIGRAIALGLAQAGAHVVLAKRAASGVGSADALNTKQTRFMSPAISWAHILMLSTMATPGDPMTGDSSVKK
jgi:NAD(P)-dependent dehydrogenase (short-subunit alcohol dehydrogenase family)